MHNHIKYLMTLMLVWPLQTLWANEPVMTQTAPTYDERCVKQALLNMAPDATIQALRNMCLIEPAIALDTSPIEKRIRADRLSQFDQFSIQSYHPNYILFGSYNFAETNEKPFRDTVFKGDEFFEPVEAKFQISLKAPIADNILGWGDHWYLAYTNRSFWQAYNSHISSPFRETNHQPEGWISFDNDWNILGWKNRLIDIGIVHESNGQTATLSRSWNRAYLRFLFEKDNSAFSFKPWIRFPENENDDDNPDITHYMGNGEFNYFTKYTDHNFRMTLRNNFDFDDNKGALELGYTYPIHRNLNFYTQWFYGYGESLIDYNYRNNTLSIGVQIGNLY